MFFWGQIDCFLPGFH